jgi:AraC-like DNA-binding protein
MNRRSGALELSMSIGFSQAPGTEILPDQERVAANELLRSIRWSVAAVRQRRVMTGSWSRLRLDGPHFLYLSAGAVTVRVDEADLRLGPGDFLLLPRSVEVLAQPASGAAATLVSGELVADGELTRPITELMPATVFTCSTVRSSGNGDLLAMIDAELGAARNGDSAVLNRLVDLIVSTTLRSWLEGGCARATEWLVQLRDPRLQRALAAMHAEPGTSWTVETLARVAHSSRSQFAEIFRGAIGETPARYLTRVRMRRAEELLLAGRSVGQVAVDLGYVSDEGFRRAFARHSGSTPTSWLRDARSGDLQPAGSAAAVAGQVAPVWHVASA